MGKIIKSIILSALFLTLAGTGTVWAEEVMPDLSMESVSADELSMDAEPQIPGRTESTGIFFEVKDSEWLNVSLSSSELIKLTLESVPNMITMQLESAEDAISAQITIGGLAPQTTYHKYEDNYHNHEAFTTDDNGNYTYTQDLSAPHTVFLQTHKSTKFIRDDATGGDCYFIGIWDSPTKTCMLTTDLNETIQIDSDGVTLDGNGHTLTGSKTGSGVYIYRRTGVTIKNLNIKTFAYGIYLRESSNNSLTNNYASTNSIGIYLYSSSNNVLNNNTANSNGTGISVSSSSNNTLSSNTMSSNTRNNFTIGGSEDLHYDNNINTSNLVEGKPIYYIRNAQDQTYDATINAGAFYCINCNNIIIDGLSITTNKKNQIGIYLWKTQNSTIKNVILSNNSTGISLINSTNNTITNNTISNNKSSGIGLSSSNNNALTNNTILSNSTGISVGFSNNNTLSWNNASNNSYGIYLSSSGSNTITGNTASGIYLSSSSSNTITGNTASNGSYGISIGSSNNNILTGNSSSSNTYGISLSNSSYNTLSNNTMNGNAYNFNLILQYDEPEVSYDNNIDMSNLVDGKPIYYIRNASDQTYDSTTNAGVFYCINCSNITIEGLTLTKNQVGVLLWKTQNSKIRNVTASNVGAGIFGGYASNNTFENNNLSGASSGIELRYANNNNDFKNNNVSNNNYGVGLSGDGNTLTNNTINANFYSGIGISGSNNIVSGNTISNHHGNYPFGGGGDGISTSSDSNTIYNNNFISNAKHVSYSSKGTFNLPVPVGGNYWSGWTTPDNDGDGFVDVPYEIYTDWSHAAVSTYDNLPWARQDGWKTSDTIAPITAITISGTSGNNGWYISDVQVTLTATDNDGGSGVSKTEYSFNGTIWYTYSGSFTANLEGQNTLYYRSADNTGNTEATKTQTVKIDTTTPTTTASLSGSLGDNGWYVSDVEVRLAAADSYSGVKEIHYIVDGVEYVTNGDQATFTLTEDGSHVVKYWAVDNAGIISGYEEELAYRDSAPPVTTPSIAGGVQGSGGYYTSCVTVALQTTSSSSGTAVTEYSLDEGQTWQAYTGEFEVCNNSATTAEVTVAYRSTSVAGIKEGPKTLIINIDQTPPVITAAATPDANQNGWHNTDVTVTFTCTDSASGVAQCPSPITVSSEGAGQILSGTAVDKAGNSATASVTLNIDKTPPSITGAATTSPNANGWYSTDVAVHFTASDNMSGINTLTPDITISTEGANQSISGTVFDMAGNFASAAVSGINIDKTAPVITITSPMAAQYDHSARINVSFTATDSVSGVFKNTVSLDGQQYDPANPISLLYLSLGTHTLRVESENYAGLKAAQSVDFKIIATAGGTTSLITMFYQTGAIDSAGIATSLTQMLQAGQLEAFINMLEAQSGKHISTSAADLLIADALYMVGQL